MNYNLQNKDDNRERSRKFYGEIYHNMKKCWLWCTVVLPSIPPPPSPKQKIMLTKRIWYYLSEKTPISASKCENTSQEAEQYRCISRTINGSVLVMLQTDIRIRVLSGSFIEKLCSGSLILLQKKIRSFQDPIRDPTIIDLFQFFRFSSIIIDYKR